MGICIGAFDWHWREIVCVDLFGFLIKSQF